MYEARMCVCVCVRAFVCVCVCVCVCCSNTFVLLLHIRNCLHYHVFNTLICACPLIHHVLSTGLQNSC